jgi:MFS family permease
VSRIGEQATLGPRAALRVSPYRRWFLAQIFSSSGASMQLIGMSWVIVQHTDSGLAIGALTFVLYIPILVLGPWAGRIIDRTHRRSLLLGTQVFFFLIGLVLTAAAVTGVDSVPFLYGAALLSGIATAFDAPARQVYLMDVLPRDLLPAAIGMYEIMVNAARILGPAVAGALLALGGVVPCFAFNAVAFLPAIYALLRNRGTIEHSEPHRARVSRWAGLRWSFARPHIVVMLLLGTVTGMLVNLPTTVTLITTQTFHLPGSAYGLLVAAFGMGALVGALRASTQRGEPRGRPTAVLALIAGVLTLTTALAPNVWTFSIGMCVLGGVSIWFIARANTLVQLAAPPDLRGQVMSAWNMAIPGMNPFTGLLAGLTADLIGARAGLGLPGALYVLVAGTALIGSTFVSGRGR